MLVLAINAMSIYKEYGEFQFQDPEEVQLDAEMDW